MSEVIEFPGETTLDIAPEKVLQAALQAGLVDVLVVASDEEGNLYLASSTGDRYKQLWLLEVAKLEVLEVDGM